MRYLTLREVLALYERVLQRSGGLMGIRDLGGLESALAQPRMTYGGEEFYPDIGTKAAALGYSLIMNHPFVDGNKRVGHAAMEVFLVLNGYEIKAGLDEQERVILSLAASKMSRAEFTTWIQDHISKKVEQNE